MRSLLKKHLQKLIQNSRGQIAIFVVLVFQVLFVLFAMTINVGLMIHDKINFQNSLDLAAYYGAQRQAEVLNVMAHINYQMRQNWKLLAWRYRILGTLGQPVGWQKTDGGPQPFWCPQNKALTIDCILSPADQTGCPTATYNSTGTGYCDYAYAICISESRLWARGTNHTKESLCTLVGKIKIPRIQPTQIVPGPLAGLGGIAQAAIHQLQEDADENLELEGALNWLMAELFLGHFRLDQADRKTMMQAIYDSSLKAGKDLEGKSIDEGAKKVFKNNLTENNNFSYENTPNNERFVPDFPTDGENFDEFFQPYNVSPFLQFVTFPNNGGEFTDLKNTFGEDGNYISFINTYNYPINIDSRLEKIFKLSQSSIIAAIENPVTYKDAPLMQQVLGFYKEPTETQTIYYALKGELKYQPKIFRLNVGSPIPFKGTAIAKPFGGRFGPGRDQQDPLIPATNSNIQSIPHIPSSGTMPPPFELQPNYSRWPGDEWGLIDPLLHNQWPRGGGTDQFLTKFGQLEEPTAPINSTKASYSDSDPKIYTITAFLHLFFDASSSDGYSIDDPLARPRIVGRGDEAVAFSFMRMMELMAVYPDAFDIANYSIMGNYMDTYFPLVCKLLTGDPGNKCDPRDRNQNMKFTGRNPTYIRGDFGWPYHEKYRNINEDKKGIELSIAPYFLKQGDARDVKNDQVINMSPAKVNPPPSSTQPPLLRLTSGKLFYPWIVKELPGDLLSSWAPPITPDRYRDYTLNDLTFLKCQAPAKTGMPSPSACAIGGRSGYSVKLISCEALSSRLTGFC